MSHLVDWDFPYKITHKASERERPNQNPAKVRQKWYHQIFKTNFPRQTWNYGVLYVCAVMRMTASYSG